MRLPSLKWKDHRAHVDNYKVIKLWLAAIFVITFISVITFLCVHFLNFSHPLLNKN